MPVSSQTIQRDKENARAAKEYAHNQLKELRSSVFVDDITGSYSLTNRALMSHYSSEQKSLIAICELPFHALAEDLIKTPHSKNTELKVKPKSDVAKLELLLRWKHDGEKSALAFAEALPASSLTNPAGWLSSWTAVQFRMILISGNASVSSEQEYLP